VEWLKGLFTVVATPPAITHSIAEAINIVLLDETYQCNIDGVDVAASLLVEAQMNAVIDTSFGLTIVANLAYRQI
jgi:chitinase